MDKEEVVRIYSGMLLSLKKNEIMPSAATWMDLEMIGEVKSERERQMPYDPAIPLLGIYVEKTLI